MNARLARIRWRRHLTVAALWLAVFPVVTLLSQGIDLAARSFGSFDRALVMSLMLVPLISYVIAPNVARIVGIVFDASPRWWRNLRDDDKDCVFC
ncbi:MAG: hypothetical protein AB7N54_14840 [Alphaproteobacteria bacterium]